MNRFLLTQNGRCRSSYRKSVKPRKRAFCRRRGMKRTGATLVEFALVSNLLFLTIFACMEFARMNMARNLAQDAAYFAARIAVVPGATQAEAEAEGTRIMNSMFGNGFTVNCNPISSDTSEIEVTVAVDLDDVALFLPMVLGNVELKSTARMKTERYSGYYQQ